MRNDVSAPGGVEIREGGSVWLDAVGFACGLGLAWWRGWKTADLVWSLWLSSLVVGYVLIVWNIAGPLFERRPDEQALAVGPPGLPVGGRLLGALLLLAFFTVHYGGFHLGHSIFLTVFFPIVTDPTAGFFATYAEVWSRYWIWLPVAFLAERAAFTPAVSAPVPEPRPQPGAANPKALSASMLSPYQNVIRMHLLIFFFAGAHFANLENIYVYAVVYAVYFAPWRRLFRRIQPRLGLSA